MKKVIWIWAISALILIVLGVVPQVWAGDVDDIAARKSGDDKIISAHDFWESTRNNPEMRACVSYIDAGLKAPITDADVDAFIYNGTTAPDDKSYRAGKRILAGCTVALPKVDFMVEELRK